MLPVYQQLTKSPGNFVAMQHGVSDSQQQAVGFGYALRLLVQTVGVPPLFLRQATSFGIVNRTWGELGPLRILSALVIIGVLIAGTVLAFRRRDRIATAAGVVAFLALALSTLTIARLPEQVLDVTRYRMLEAWVAGAFFWFATAFVVVRALPERVTNAAPLRIVATVGAACIPSPFPPPRCGPTPINRKIRMPCLRSRSSGSERPRRSTSARRTSWTSSPMSGSTAPR
jgi:hypothetical protein